MNNPTPSADRKKRYLGVALLMAFILLVVAYYLSASCPSLPGMGSCRRILFIGNS